MSTGKLRRVTGDALLQLRRDWFDQHPLCVHCLAAGRVRVATELDHIVPLHQGGKDFDVDEGSNRQGLCRDCHERKSQQERGRSGVLRGADVNGLPTDPEHPWNKRSQQG